MSNGAVISGHILDLYIEEGNNPADIQSLPETLLGDSIDGLRTDHFRPRTESKMTNEECISFGRWILKVTAEAGSKPKIDRQILRRAHILGLGVGPDQLVHPARFGSLGNYYKELGEASASRNRTFDNWSSSDVARYLFRLGAELGRKPTESDVRSLSNNNPNYPSPYICSTVCGSFRHALELAGWINVYAMTPDDHIEHAVKFMLANDGKEPTQEAWDYLSKKKVGPSASIIRYKFNGGFSELKTIANQQYKERLVELDEIRENKLRSIEDAVSAGDIPREIFDGAHTEDEIITRYAKYLVVDLLLSDQHSVSKVSIASERNESIKYDGFIGSIRKVNNAVTAGDVESTALYLGFFDDIWPLDEYRQRLRLPDDTLGSEHRKHGVWIPSQQAA